MVEVKLIGYFFKYLSIAISAPVSILIATALILMSGVDYSFIMAAVPRPVSSPHAEPSAARGI